MWSINIENSNILKYLLPGTHAIALYPFIICIDSLDDITLNHENIHLHQQCELCIVGFYSLYVYYYIKELLKGKYSTEAYLNIPFESEAYSNEENIKYLIKRKKMSWIKYI